VYKDVFNFQFCARQLNLEVLIQLFYKNNVEQRSDELIFKFICLIKFYASMLNFRRHSSQRLCNVCVYDFILLGRQQNKQQIDNSRFYSAVAANHCKQQKDFFAKKRSQFFDAEQQKSRQQQKAFLQNQETSGKNYHFVECGVVCVCVFLCCFMFVNWLREKYI